MNRYWFRPRSYGWGFTPISYEGWIATFALIGMIVLSAERNGIRTQSSAGLAGFLFDMVILTIVSYKVFRPRTKGKLRFRWGKYKGD